MELILMPDRRPSILACLLTLLMPSLSVTADSAIADDPPPMQIDIPGQVEQPSLDRPLGPTPVPQERALPMNFERNLAGQFIRNAATLLQESNLTVRGMEAALLFTQEAVDLSPDDPEAWNFHLAVAMLNERDDVVRTASERLAKLDPENDRALLQKLRSEIAEKQTAAERAERYKHEIGRGDLPVTVRSRLALDLAILERRRGRTEAFASWLAESVALDRSHTAAAALAAGYFRLHVDDPVGTGELLLNQFLANPTDISAQMLAANHFLDHGAYDAADRLYTLAKNCYESIQLVALPGELIADLAIARWGAGRMDTALRQIMEYQRRMDIRYRERLLHEDPELTPLDRAKRQAPRSLTVIVTHAVLRARQGDEQGRAMMQRIIDLYQQRIETMVEEAQQEAERLDPRVKEEIAKLWLETAWLTVWLSPTPENADEYAARASELIELSERAEARIAGWIALRNGDPDRAVDLLERHAGHDPAAGLGYANALLARGQRRSAAQALLNVVRLQPGTLIGAWAGDQLAELIGRRVPISSDAAHLDDLMREVPSYLDRFPAHPTTALSVRLRPTKDRFDPYEPIRIDLKLTNHASRPLAIDPEGPILPDVVLLFDVRLSGATDHPAVTPLIVSIDRRLRLEPHERLTIPLDLRRAPLGAVLDQHPLHGAIVTIRVISNFFVTPHGAILPNLLGSEQQAPSIRIDGKRITEGGVERMHNAVTGKPDRTIVPDMAILLYLYVGNSFRQLNQAERQWLARQILAVTEAYSRLDPVAQTWLLSVLPVRTGVLRPLLDVARRSEHRLVQLGVLLYGGDALNTDDMRAFTEHDDPIIRRIARIVTDSPEEVDIHRDAFGESEMD